MSVFPGPKSVASSTVIDTVAVETSKTSPTQTRWSENPRTTQTRRQGTPSNSPKEQIIRGHVGCVWIVTSEAE
jgi:hypothetical protein